MRGRILGDQAGGQVSSQEIIEGGAMPIESLQEAPVAGEPAQIFVRAGPQLGQILRRLRRRPQRNPPGWPARRTQDAALGRGLVDGVRRKRDWHGPEIASERAGG